MAGPDLSPLMAAINFDSVLLAVVGVYAAWLVVLVAQWGAEKVLDAVRSAAVERHERQQYDEWLADEERRWGRGGYDGYLARGGDRTSAAEQRRLDSIDDDLLRSL